jgi:ankyrin repeat protein
MGQTPLMIATTVDDLAWVRLLLAQGAAALDCVCGLGGSTAFHYACLHHADVAEALVRAGRDTTMQDNDGCTGRDLVAIQKGRTHGGGASPRKSSERPAAGAVGGGAGWQQAPP